MAERNDFVVFYSNGNWFINYINENGVEVEQLVKKGGLDTPFGSVIKAIMNEIYPDSIPNEIVLYLPKTALPARVRLSEKRQAADDDPWVTMTPEEIMQIPEKEFLRVVNETIFTINVLEQQLKPLKKRLSRLGEARLYKLLETYEDRIVELEDVLIRLGKKETPKVNYRALIDDLIAARPELEVLVKELKEAQMSKKTTPKRRKLTHIKGEEPDTWKETKRIKLSWLDDEDLAALLEEHIAVLDALLDNLYAVMEEATLKAASTDR